MPYLTFSMGLFAAKQQKTVKKEPRSFYRDRSESLRADATQDFKVKSLPRILLIDDDPTYGLIMERVARQNAARLHHVCTPDQIPSAAEFGFDVLVVDYDLGSVTGYEMTSYLERHMAEEIPVILVSHSERNDTHSWPDTIREFVHKKLGPYAVLDAAFEAYEVDRLHRAMDRRNTK